MTKTEFRDWVSSHGCEFVILNGANLTGTSIRIVNKQYRIAYYYMRLPFDEYTMPDNQICDACSKLLIEVPPGIDCGMED